MLLIIPEYEKLWKKHKPMALWQAAERVCAPLPYIIAAVMLFVAITWSNVVTGPPILVLVYYSVCTNVFYLVSNLVSFMCYSNSCMIPNIQHIFGLGWSHIFKDTHFRKTACSGWTIFQMTGRDVFAFHIALAFLKVVCVVTTNTEPRLIKRTFYSLNVGPCQQLIVA